MSTLDRSSRRFGLVMTLWGGEREAPMGDRFVQGLKDILIGNPAMLRSPINP